MVPGSSASLDSPPVLLITVEVSPPALSPRRRRDQDQEIRRTLKLPQRCVDVLHDQARQEIRSAAGGRWQDNDLVFPSRAGTPADAPHIRPSFRKVVAAAGLDPHEWTPRELRRSFVSPLSDADVPIEQISRLVGHSSSTTTETIYRNLFAQDRAFILKAMNQAVSRLYVQDEQAA